MTSIGSVHSSSQESSLEWNGTLSNTSTGSIALQTGAVSDYRYLEGNLSNFGLVDVSSPLGYYEPSGTYGGEFINRKTLSVAAAATLTTNGATIVNGTAGICQVNGDFTQSGYLSGDIAAHQSVTIAGITATNSTYVQAATDFTNAGTLTLTSQGASSGGAQDAELDWPGRLTNTGTINVTSGASGGDRYLQGAFLDNSATMSVAITLQDTVGAARLTNSGTVKVTAGRQVDLTDGTYAQTAAGTFATTVNAIKAGVIVPNLRANLDGALTVTGTPKSGHTYVVIGPTGVRSGTFASVTGGYPPNYLPTRVSITAA